MSNKVLAYIAPEIPSLSATFVYNEIFALEEMGYEIFPISLYCFNNYFESNELKTLKEKVFNIYDSSILSIVFSNCLYSISHPIKFYRTYFLALGDAIKLGLLNRIGIGLLYRFHIAVVLARYLQVNKVEHIHAHFSHTPTDIAMYSSLLSGIPYSFTSHANDLFERLWLAKEKVKRSKRSVTISQYNVEFLKKKGVDEEKISVVHCNVRVKVDGDKLKPPFDKDTITIGTLGRLVEKKGIDVLLSSLESIQYRKKTIRLVIAGDGPLMGDLKQLATSSKAGIEISFIGAVPHKEVNDWLSKIDLFVLPCKTDRNGDKDGIPVVLMEAMAMGIPVISSHISGIPELIQDGKTGYLADENNPQSLSKKIDQMLGNPQNAMTMRDNAIEHLLSEFSIDKNITILDKIFTKE